MNPPGHLSRPCLLGRNEAFYGQINSGYPRSKLHGHLCDTLAPSHLLSHRRDASIQALQYLDNNRTYTGTRCMSSTNAMHILQSTGKLSSMLIQCI